MKDFIFSFLIYLVITISLFEFFSINEWYRWLNAGGMFLLIEIIDIALKSTGLIDSSNQQIT